MMVEYLGGTFRVGPHIFDAAVKAKPRAASGGAKKQDGRGERSRVSRRVIADDDDDDDETNVWEAEIESAVEFFRSVRGAVVDEREAAVLRHGAEEYLKDGGDAEFLTDYLASAFYAKAESGVAENQDVAGLRRVASDLEKNQEARRLATAFGAGGDHSERATAKLFKGLKAVYGVERADRDAYPPVLLELLASLRAIGLHDPDDAAADPDDDDDDDEASYCGAYDDDDDDYVTLEDLEEFDGFLEAIASLSGPADPPAVDAAILAGIERATSLGWDVDTLTVGGDGVLHVAAEHGRADLARALVGDWGASVDLGNAAERTALHVAAEGNFVPVMLALVAGGADVDALDDEGSAPARRAAADRLAALEFLADRGLLYDATANPALVVAAGANQSGAVAALLLWGAADLDDAIAYAARAEDRARARGPDGDRRRFAAARGLLEETRRAQLTLMVEGVAFELSWVAIVAGLVFFRGEQLLAFSRRGILVGAGLVGVGGLPLLALFLLAWAVRARGEMDAPPPDALRLADASARSARAEAEAAARECAEIQASRTATHKEKWQAKKRARKCAVAKEEAAKRQANQERAEALARVEARKAEAERLEALRKKASAEARARDEAKARATDAMEARAREEARAEARAIVRAREAEAERLEAARILARAEILAREEAEARQKAVEARAREEAEARARAEAERARAVLAAQKAEAERLEAARKQAAAEERARREAEARARAAARKAEAERLEAQKAAAEKAERKKAAAERKKAEAERKKAEAERKAAARAEAEARRKAEAEARAAFEREAELLGAEEEKHAGDDYDDARVVETLAGLGLASYLPLFREQEIDDGALLGLEADDLSDMGVAPAAALRILSAINALRMAASKLAVNEVMDDSERHQAVLEAELKDHRARIAKLQLADVPEDLLCCISCEIMKDPLGRSDAVKLLLDAGAVETDSAELFYGQTAVFTAAAWGHLGIVRLLTEHGHDVERENVNGASAAMAAAERGHAGVLGFLIGAGADFQKADNAGVTPLYRAKKNGHKDVVALLLDAGAEELHADLPKRAWEAEPQPTGRTKTCKKAKSKQECKKVKSGGEKACKWKNDKCKAKGGDTGGSCEDNTSKGSCKKDAFGCKWKNDKCRGRIRWTHWTIGEEILHRVLSLAREAQTGLAAEAEQTRAEAAAALINAAKQDEARALEKAGRKAKAKAKARARQAELAAKVQRTREAARAREAELAAEAKAREAAAAREAELAAKQAREEARGLEAARARELSVKAAAETKAREQARAREAAAAREKAKAEARAGEAASPRKGRGGGARRRGRARRSWPPRRRRATRRWPLRRGEGPEAAAAREAAANAPTRVEPEACGAEEAKHADDDYDDARVVEILAGSGNASLVPLFREHEVDDGALLGLEADDLSDMGVAPAAALRILCAINAQRMAASKLAVNEVMDDSARHQAVLEAELKDHRARIAKLQLADVPEDLLCCISCEIMKDPVSADDGNTYERVCIEQWFATGKRTSPRTNEPLESLKLRPNHAIRRLTATYLESRGKDF
ncbi:ubiquitin-protein transferase [Aureococcus anophagefferens]|nr:ubiquitin-protein transferase [Aureococcus anophagefferens]